MRVSELVEVLQALHPDALVEGKLEVVSPNYPDRRLPIPLGVVDRSESEK